MRDAAERSETSWRLLEDVWQQSCAAWRDSTAGYFASRFWEPLADETAAYLRAVDELMEILRAARDAVG
jgi:hypothetical protein